MGYTPIGLLARGGTAVVDLAVGPDGRHVARKRIVLTGTWREIDLARQRMAREAELLRRLDHPHIVPLWALEEDGDDLVLVMPYLSGGSLGDRVAAHGPLTAAEVKHVGRALLGALSTAHRLGIVHRDIKPANVLFDGWGRPALCDFGIAWSRDSTSSLTMAGTVIGTPAFMAPEQAGGAPAGAAADVFSLGATLAFALTGQLPYGQGPPEALLARAAKGRVAPLPASVPADLRRPLAAMLATDPSRRPTAAEALGGPSGTQVLPARRRRLPRLPAPLRRPRRPLLLAGSAVLVAATVALALTAGASGRSVASGHPPAGGRRPAASGRATAGCTPLPYQACGQPAAPFTDGRTCIDGHADYDGNPVNGCEAAPDNVNGTALTTGSPILANLVPAGEVDTYSLTIPDHLAIYPFCDREVDVTLTAPAGATDRVDIIANGRDVAHAVSSGGQEATAVFPKPGCFATHGGTFAVRVSSVSGRSACDYRLERSGSW